MSYKPLAPAAAQWHRMKPKKSQPTGDLPELLIMELLTLQTCLLSPWTTIYSAVFTCVAEGESRSRSAVTPSVCPSVCLSVCPSVRPKILSSKLLWNYCSNYHETWYVDRTSYGVMHIGRKFWSPHFCGSYVPWNLENIRKSTNNLSFLCQFFIN